MSEDERVLKSQSFVEKVNSLAREVPGGEVFHDLGVSKEDAGKNCPMCQLGGQCLGPNCLEISGNFLGEIISF